MDRDGLLRTIAETGYNVGFGAKKHFATYDIVDKLPGLIGFISIAVGIFSLVIDPLSAKLPSAVLTVAGIAAIYIGFYDHKKSEYEQTAIALTQLFNRLRDLYLSIKSGADITQGVEILRAIEVEFYSKAISNQILFSDWYAHYKFFAQQQIEWIDEQKKFTWRDKFPLSLLFSIGVLIACLGIGLLTNI